MELKSRTLTHQLAYIAIMSAITIIFSVLTNFFPLVSLLLLLFLPFISALVAITCDLKLFPIYLVSVILLSIVFDATNFLGIVFYLIPGLISGLVIGIGYRQKINGIYMLIGIALVNFVSNYATIPVLDYLYQIDTVNYSMGFIGFSNHPLINDIFIGILFVTATIQATITFLIVDGEIKIFKQEANTKYSMLDTYICIIFSLMTILATFFHIGLAIVFFSVSTILSIYLLIHLFSENMTVGLWVLFISVGTIPVSLVLNELYRTSYLPLYLILPVLIIVIGVFLWEYILKQRINIDG